MKKTANQGQAATRQPRPIQDPSELKKTSLRISLVVHGREHRGERVFFLVDPTGAGSQKKVAESVVLHRWRRRKVEGYSFSGARLGPAVWRTLPRVLGGDPAQWVRLSCEEIRSRRATCLAKPGEGESAELPCAEVLHALLAVCGPERLAKLVDHFQDPKRFGTPDLFLYATEKATGLPGIARFVEVKRPDERLKPHQREEITFLQAMGLHARVVRLMERA